MLTRHTATLYTTALAFTALLHCSSSSSKPSNTPASEAGSGSGSEMSKSDASSSLSAASEADHQAAASNGSSAASASSKMLDDAQIAAITDAANRAEVDQGRLAQSKAKDPRVRSFAAMMVSHHGEARQDQQALSVGKRDSTDSQRLSSEADSALESLQQKSGAEFDRAYIQLQCDEHRKVLETLDQQLLPAAKDPALAAYLGKLKPRVQEHLAQAERLQKELASSGSKSSQAQDPSASPRALNR